MKDEEGYPIGKDSIELMNHMCGLGTATACDGIIAYLQSPDCSKRTLQRIKKFLEREEGCK